jgi:hypothetical protein
LSSKKLGGLISVPSDFDLSDVGVVGERSDAPRFCFWVVPCLCAGFDDGMLVIEDAMREEAFLEVEP